MEHNHFYKQLELPTETKTKLALIGLSVFCWDNSVTDWGHYGSALAEARACVLS